MFLQLFILFLEKKLNFVRHLPKIIFCPLESAIVLDLLMFLPEELSLLDCNKLHKHLLQVKLHTIQFVTGYTGCTKPSTEIKLYFLYFGAEVYKVHNVNTSKSASICLEEQFTTRSTPLIQG